MTFRKMTQNEAIEISNWHYDGVYKFYNLEEDPEDYEEFINEETRNNTYSVFNKNELIGYFDYNLVDNSVVIGFGLKPEYTGKGFGEKFLRKIIEYIKDNLKVDLITLDVACFNLRAIKVYHKVGFIPKEKYKQKTNGGIYDFLHMEYRINNEDN